MQEYVVFFNKIHVIFFIQIIRRFVRPQIELQKKNSKLQSAGGVGTHKVATCRFRISVEAIRFRGIGAFERPVVKLG